MGRRLLVSILTVFAFGVGTANAANYYVSPAGSDSSAGTSSAPWKTVGRVNGAALSPGDNVLFQGGQTFTDDTLMPTASGTAGAPITFGSYGTGRATITNPGGAVWFSGKSYLTFDGLALTTGGANGVIFSGSSGTSSYITIRNSVLTNTGYSAINAPNRLDNHWLIADNTISQTGDSGLIILGSDFTISGNTITGTGRNTALTYGKHGIYGKGPNMVIANNDISAQQNGSAVSIRYGGAQVYGNTIHDTAYPFSYLADDAGTGVVRIYGNRAWNITGFAFYYGSDAISSSSSLVDVVLASNTFVMAGASEAVNVSEVTKANVTIANNVFAGSYGSALRAPVPVGGKVFSEHHNVWSGAASSVPSGVGDLRVNPALSAPSTLAPSAGSPVVNQGSTGVGGLSYTAACDGQPLHYCGTAPEIGATEYLPPAAGTTGPSAPAGLTVTASGQSSISLTWMPSTDDVGVAGYDVYANGVKMATTASSTATVAGLTCSTSYTVGVQAFDAAGNRSALATVPGTTETCASNPVVVDTTPPKVTIASPASGAGVGRTFTVRAGAVDAAGIAQLRFLLNGVRVCVVYGTSGSCAMAAKSGWNSVTVQALDNAGNVGMAAIRIRVARVAPSATKTRSISAYRVRALRAPRRP